MMQRRRRGDDSVAVAQAELLAAYEATWRHWRAFVVEQQDTLRRRQVAEDADDLLGQASAAPVRANLPLKVRGQLSDMLEARRLEAQDRAEAAARQAGRPAPDPDAVLGELLAVMDAELRGQVDPRGWAILSFEGEPIAFDHRSLIGATDADYLAAGADPWQRQRQRLIIGGVLGAVALIGLLAFLLRPQPQAVARESGPPAALVADQPQPLWDVTTAAVGGVTDTIPGASLGYPLLLCLTDAQQQALDTAPTVTVSGAAGVRTYAVAGSVLETRADLVLADCTVTPPVLLRSGTLVSSQTHTALVPDTVRVVAAYAPDTDPAGIPAGRMRVEVVVAHADAPQGALILADGSRWAPTAHAAAAADTTRLTYLVPLRESAQPAGWALTARQPAALAALTIPAPESRAALLRRLLTVSDPAVVARGGDETTAPQLALTLRVTLSPDAPPLTLLPGDLTVRADEALRTDVAWTPPALQPGETVTVTAQIPLSSAAPLDMALGAWRARVRW